MLIRPRANMGVEEKPLGLATVSPLIVPSPRVSLRETELTRTAVFVDGALHDPVEVRCHVDDSPRQNQNDCTCCDQHLAASGHDPSFDHSMMNCL